MKSLFLLGVFAVILKSYPAKLEEHQVFQSDDTVDDIITKVMQNDQRPHDVTLSKRNSQSECNLNLKFPESSNVQIIDSNKKIKAQPYHCQSGPFAVPIPAPMYFMITPTTIMLHRCFGGFWTRHEHCVVTKKEKILVEYLEYNYETGMINWATATMYNHTECGSGCIVKASDCKPNETYDPNQCGCKCTISQSSCTSVNKTLENCQCECPVAQPCHSIYKEWDPVKCQCVCAKSMRDLCLKHNRILDQNTCFCT